MPLKTSTLADDYAALAQHEREFNEYYAKEKTRLQTEWDNAEAEKRKCDVAIGYCFIGIGVAAAMLFVLQLFSGLLALKVQ